MTNLNDEDWVPGPSNLKTKSKFTENCIIHCTDDNSDLVSLQSLDSWKVLLEAATTRQHEGVLKVASSLPDGVVPDIKYHRKCRSTFTMKKLLNNIKKKKTNLVNSKNFFLVGGGLSFLFQISILKLSCFVFN